MTMFDIGNSFIVFGLFYALFLVSENGWSFDKIFHLLKRVFFFLPFADLYNFCSIKSFKS